MSGDPVIRPGQIYRGQNGLRRFVFRVTDRGVEYLCLRQRSITREDFLRTSPTLETGAQGERFMEVWQAYEKQEGGQ